MRKFIFLVPLMILAASSLSLAASVWTTDAYGNEQTDFAPEETVYIHGSSFLPDSPIDVSVSGPDDSSSTGHALTNSEGNFTYEYILLKIVGNYTVYAYDGTNSASVIFSDAAIFTRLDGCGGSKDENQYGPGEDVWIEGDGLDSWKLYNWKIYGLGGSCDSGIVVASGQQWTNIWGDFCFFAYTTQTDDCGEYRAHVERLSGSGGRNDNYHIACVDRDDDGYDSGPYAGCMAGDDCDDSDPDVNPGKTEICDNGIDDDCDTLTDCDDSYCSGNPACARCGNGIVETGEDCDGGECCDADCTFMASGTSCDDGLFCSVGEACNGAGTCTGGSARDCSDGNECTGDVCDDINDECDNPDVEDGTECGLSRDCPLDTCVNPFWYDYPDSGHDFCTSGACIQWSCGYLSRVCDKECGAACENDKDCTNYCSANGRYYNGDCESACSCSYLYESCGEETRTCTLGENCACEGGKYFCETDDDKSCENGCTEGTCNSVCTPDSCDRTNQGTDTDGDGWDNECETCDSTYCRQTPGTEICDNGCDDDCDGLEDCADPECVGETGPNEKECCQSDSTCNDENICTDDVCSSNECTYTNNNAPCEDGLFCYVNDFCSGGTCNSGSPRDCSGNDLTEIATCTNTPDANPFTWDYAAGFTSTCNEEDDICTSSSYSYTHTCSVSSCGAECDASSQKRCLSPGTNIITVLNGKCYAVPEFDTCYDNCTWSNCAKIELPAGDPRCIINVKKPSCGGTTGIRCPFITPWTTTTIPRTTTTLPKLSFPSFSLPTFRIW